MWLLDVGRNTSTRLTYEQRRATFPIWSSDGSGVIFDSVRAGEVNLYLKMANGAGDERPLLKSGEEYKYPTSSSRDGRFLLYTVENPQTKSDLWVLPLDGDHTPVPFLRTEFNERSGQFSPDGHWVAYTSDESGGDEIYVREFSSGPAQGSRDAARKWLISKGGGTDPNGAGMAKDCFMWLPTGRLCPSTSAPSRYSRRARQGRCSNCRLVLLAATSPPTADAFSSVCPLPKALPCPLRWC